MASPADHLAQARPNRDFATQRRYLATVTQFVGI